MADRQIVVSKLVDAGAMSSTITSSTLDIRDYDKVSVQAVWSAGSSPVGVVTVEGSLDGTNFDAFTFSSTLSVSGNTGKISVEVETGFPFMRVVYTRTSGSGTLNVYVFGKGR